MSSSTGRVAAFIFSIFILSVGILYLLHGSNDPLTLPFLPEGAYLPVITVSGSPIAVLIADTEKERTKGLSNRSSLPPKQGMLFIFDKDDRYGIWMKDMLFSIDIIWIDEEGNIVDIIEHATPESYPQVFAPEKPARYVLEVPSGFVEIRNITKDGTIDFSAMGR